MNVGETSGDGVGFELDIAIADMQDACHMVKRRWRWGARGKTACIKELLTKLEALKSAAQVQHDRIVDLQETIRMDDQFIAAIEERTEKKQERQNKAPSFRIVDLEQTIKLDDQFISAIEERTKKRQERQNKAPSFLQTDPELASEDESSDIDWEFFANEEEAYYRDYGKELTGSFAIFCRRLHIRMCAKLFFVGRRMSSLEEFYTELGKEGSAGDEEHRWSKPLHLRLAETLVESGFSKEDWDLSLPTGDGGILLRPIEVNDWEDAERANLTAEQIELLTRIKRYLMREIYPGAEDEGVSPTSHESMMHS